MILSIIAIVVSFGSLTLACIVFRRDRKFHNENILFSAKISCYERIVKLYASLIFQLEEYQINFSAYLNSKERNKQWSDKEMEKLDNLGEIVDRKIDKFIMELMGNALVLPNSILKVVSLTIDTLYQESIPDLYHNDNRNALELFQKTLDKLNEQVGLINDEMRNDIGFEQLDKSLSKRVSCRNLGEEIEVISSRSEL